MSLDSKLRPSIEFGLVSGLLFAGACGRAVGVLSGPELGDRARYWNLADSLIQGRGYSMFGVPEIGFAPGYPVFLALVRMVRDTQEFIAGAQVTMALATCALIYLICRHLAGPAFALIFLAWHALTPVVLLQAAMISSEGLTTFLMTSLIAAAILCEAPRHRSGCVVLVGALAAAGALTAPHTIFMGAAMSLAVVARSRARRNDAFLLCLGWLVCLGPWQIHCVRAIGKPVVTILQLRSDAYRFGDTGFAAWLWAWYERPSDVALGFVGLDKFETFPNRAFVSPEERKHLTGLVRGRSRESSKLPPSIDSEFAIAAKNRAAIDRPWDPARRILVRSFYLWTEYFPGPTWLLLERGMPFSSQWLRRVVWYSGFASHAIFLAMGFLAVFAVVRHPTPLTLALFAGLCAYTLGSATFAFCEERRNVTLYPAILSLAASSVGAIRQTRLA
jgi:hypothetical protein